MITDFTLLTDAWVPASNDPLTAILEGLGLLARGERVEGVARAGDGNMNLTLRVTTTARSLIVKQARPWVEKYPTIAAPVERTRVEHAFYTAVASIEGVADRMPRVLGTDTTANVLVLEDLGRVQDLTSLYRGGALDDGALSELASYLAALHSARAHVAERFPANMAMRQLNHQHIFVVPLDPDNGLDLDVHEPGLRRASLSLLRDPHVRARFDELGARYLGRGPSLIHGDFFPGSWVNCEQGVRIIDPEFAFAGDPELDVGVALGHLCICSGGLAGRWLDAVRAAYSGFDLDLRRVVELAAVEIIRRLIGVAQLPLPPSHGARAALLERAHRALRSPDLEAFGA